MGRDRVAYRDRGDTVHMSADKLPRPAPYGAVQAVLRPTEELRMLSASLRSLGCSHCEHASARNVSSLRARGGLVGQERRLADSTLALGEDKDVHAAVVASSCADIFLFWNTCL